MELLFIIFIFDILIIFFGLYFFKDRLIARIKSVRLGLKDFDNKFK